MLNSFLQFLEQDESESLVLGATNHVALRDRALFRRFEAHRRRADAGIQVHGAVPGLYVQFESQPGVPLKLSSLEDARQGIAPRRTFRFPRRRIPG